MSGGKAEAGRGSAKWTKAPKTIYLFRQRHRGVLHVWHSDTRKRGMEHVLKNGSHLRVDRYKQEACVMVKERT